MPNAQPNGDGQSGLDRIEHLLAKLAAQHDVIQQDHQAFQLEHKQLLTAQVVLTDRLDRFVQVSTDAGKHTDERLNALISIVDGMIRKRPVGLV